MFAMISRIFTAFGPPKAEKVDGAICFGVLGAAKIAPMAIITAALSHPDVVVQAIAARDRARAEEFAKKHNIPEVKDSYQAILDDPNIDAIFIPLPNSLHYEWAMRSIQAGKHVLLEKPSVDTGTEAMQLFEMPELAEPNAPVLLEAFHSRFHPPLHKFLTFVDGPSVAHVHSDVMVPAWMTAKDNIEFNYKMGGGCMMMLGTYTFAFLRMIFGAEPEECLSVNTHTFGDGVHDQCDTDFKAQFRFPNGGIGEAEATVRSPYWWKPSDARVTHRAVVVADDALPKNQEKVRTRIVTMHGMMHAIVWHRIDVKDEFVIRDEKYHRPIRQWDEYSSYKANNFQEAGEGSNHLPGEAWWMSYRYQLEQFVNCVKGRKTQHWVSGQDSINQMKMVDMAYAKSGLGLRPTSDFR